MWIATKALFSLLIKSYQELIDNLKQKNKQKKNHTVWRYGKENNAPIHCKDVKALSTAIYEHIKLHSKGEFADVIKIIDSEMEKYSV